MHTASMNFTILSAVRSVKSVEKVTSPTLHNLPKFVRSIFGHFVIPRIQNLSSSLAEACFKMQIVVQDIERSEDSDLIDPLLEKRESLEKMKLSLKEQRADLRKSYSELDPDGAAMPKLHKEVASVVALMGELYDIATELQWAIAEHDATNSPRLEGYTASSANEVSAMLDRIAIGA